MFRCKIMTLHLLRMRRNVNRNVVNNRKATTLLKMLTCWTTSADGTSVLVMIETVLAVQCTHDRAARMWHWKIWQSWSCIVGETAGTYRRETSILRAKDHNLAGHRSHSVNLTRTKETVIYGTEVYGHTAGQCNLFVQLNMLKLCIQRRLVFPYTVTHPLAQALVSYTRVRSHSSSISCPGRHSCYTSLRSCRNLWPADIFLVEISRQH